LFGRLDHRDLSTVQVDESVETLKKGQRVSFEEGVDARRGKPEALKVGIIEA
jgi:cold shock CspA family protein